MSGLNEGYGVPIPDAVSDSRGQNYIVPHSELFILLPLTNFLCVVDRRRLLKNAIRIIVI